MATRTRTAPKTDAPKTTAAAAAPKTPTITTVADKFTDIAPTILAAVASAQQARALTAAYKLMGGKSVTTADAATGNVEKFHKAALRKFATDATFRAKCLDAAAKVSPYDLADLVGMTRNLVTKSEVMHKSVLGADNKTPMTGSAARKLYDAPDCFQFAALARLDSLPFIAGKGLATFITEQA